jgi:hypothetical protein
MGQNKRINLGGSTLTSTGANWVSVRLPKNYLEALGLVTGMNVECLAFTDPLEIIIRPRISDAVTCAGYIDQCLERSAWGLVDGGD